MKLRTVFAASAAALFAAFLPSCGRTAAFDTENIISDADLPYSGISSESGIGIAENSGTLPVPDETTSDTLHIITPAPENTVTSSEPFTVTALPYEETDIHPVTSADIPRDTENADSLTSVYEYPFSETEQTVSETAVTYAVPAVTDTSSYSSNSSYSFSYRYEDDGSYTTFLPHEHPKTGRYAYSMLSDRERRLYKEIVRAAEYMKVHVDVDESVTSEEWIRAYGCVYNQEPQLFWLSPYVAKGQVYFTEYDVSVIKEMKAAIDSNVNSIISKTQGMSDFNKLLYFHDSIIRSCTFDQEADNSHTLYGAFVLGRAQCEGYAKAMHYLCMRSGIESIVVTGSNETGATHAWNMVKVDGEWYNIDCTWDDPILPSETPSNVRYNYFLVPDEWIEDISHFNINRKINDTQLRYFTVPGCTAKADNYFYKYHLVFRDAASADRALREALTDAAAQHRRTVQIMAGSEKVYRQITDRLKNYAGWIKSKSSSVTGVAANCDDHLLIIELDLLFGGN